MKILLVEDDNALSLGIEYSLISEGMTVIRADKVKEANLKFKNNKFDLILLDVMLPDGNGYDFCREVRKESDVPVIFLTACDEEVNVVMGLDIGGDDYITKPFRVKELISRIKAVMRRHGSYNEADIFRFKDVEIDFKKGRVTKDNKEIILTPTEYKLLCTLVNNQEQILNRSQILEHLWDVSGEFIDDNTLSVYIRRIREKVEDDPSNPQNILTVRGIGYKFSKGE